MLVGVGADERRVGNRNINGAGEIIGKVAIGRDPIVNIWGFLSKSDLSSYLM